MDAGHQPGWQASARALRKRPDRRRGWACGPKHDRDGGLFCQARSSDQPPSTARRYSQHSDGNVEISIALAAPDCPTSRGFLHRRLSDAGPPPHFIFASSAAVYGRLGEVQVTEDCPTRPLSAYGRSKLIGELILEDAAAAHGLRFGILRLFNAGGADPKLRTGQSTVAAENLIKRAVPRLSGCGRRWRSTAPDHPTPDGTCIRDYIHVIDLVQAMTATLRHLRQGGESVTLNVGHGHGASVLEVIDTARRLSGVNFQIERMPRREGEAPAVVAVSERLRDTLGWRPHFDSLDLMVGSALEWQKVLISGRARERKPMRRSGALP
jgi:UDP-glucose 4-epimerase